ncbi:MAG: 3-dehydroquinate synthase [bacterium]
MKSKPHQLRVRLEAKPHSYLLQIGRSILGSVGEELRRSLKPLPNRVSIISNRKVFGLYGTQTMTGLRRMGFTVTHWLMGEGEQHKTFASAEKALLFLHQSGLERTDVVLALGGGVVGDLAGFAAASYLRGIPLVQVPTTLIAQIDSSVGGKTGVNLPGGKNLVGAFHQPGAVIIDTETLKTLPKRELVAGWCESIKNGAVGSNRLFAQTRNFLEQLKDDPDALSSPLLDTIVRAHCSFKARIVMGDEREAPSRTDNHSRRILNFGHTVGHALEAVTHYRRFRHGEAVGYGMLVAGEISQNVGLLGATELESLQEAVRLCGPLPRADDLDADSILKSIQSDKKSLAGRIQWVLLERIGRAQIVDGSKIAPQLLRDALRTGLKRRKGV